MGDTVLGYLKGAQVVYELHDTVTTIGRDSKTCDLAFDARSISKTHAVLKFDQTGEHATLEDLNSRNGCFVNDTRLSNSSRLLYHGDVIRFGYDVASYRFEYSSPTAAARKGLTRSLRSCLILAISSSLGPRQ